MPLNPDSQGLWLCYFSWVGLVYLHGIVGFVEDKSIMCSYILSDSARRYRMTFCLFIQLLTYPIVPVGRLVIDTESENAIHLSVLKGALVSCTIKVPDGNDSTIGIYYNLDLIIGDSINFADHCTIILYIITFITNYMHLARRGSTLVEISSQADAFLIEGQQKNFTCASVGEYGR